MKAAHRVAVLTATLAAVAALAYVAVFLVGPWYTVCSGPLVEPGQTATGATCRSTGWLGLQLSDPGPRTLETFRPLVFLGVWTLAPVAAAVTLRARRGLGAAAVTALALMIELTSVISIGGGFVFAIICGPLLLVSLMAALVDASASAAASREGLEKKDLTEERRPVRKAERVDRQ